MKRTSANVFSSVLFFFKLLVPGAARKHEWLPGECKRYIQFFSEPATSETMCILAVAVNQVSCFSFLMATSNQPVQLATSSGLQDDRFELTDFISLSTVLSFSGELSILISTSSAFTTAMNAS